MGVRSDLIDLFEKPLAESGPLDRFQAAGIVARWWDEYSFDLETLHRRGRTGLVQAWVGTATGVLNPESPQEEKLVKGINVFDLPGVRALLPEYEPRIDELETEVGRLEAAKEDFEAGDEFGSPEDVDEDDEVNRAKELKELLKARQADLKPVRDRVKYLRRGARVRDGGSIKALTEAGKPTQQLESEVTSLESILPGLQAAVGQVEAELAPHKAIEADLKVVRASVRELRSSIATALAAAIESLNTIEALDMILRELRQRMQVELDSQLVGHRRQLKNRYDNWHDKYAVTLSKIEEDRDAAVASLDEHLRNLGYD